eukprot:CAMPEP_0113545448 /NCGR_PEP_ID=MMETSP0015_2-20120614/11266_1 /TAXON_ID=2838 /ORGANISM="Odontella" /LENGTH=740 /DNA_ID=CAMNT_0000445813 /DNA_START=579 /DNA_END=2802 /DNA_ORIENTATION=- /assembly_acc=CAM_ASM_000160
MQASSQRSSTSSLFALPDVMSSLPFEDSAKALWSGLDIGSALGRNLDVNEVATGEVLESIGRDILVFLGVTVLVTPIAKAIKITPILGYLVMGAFLGPHGLDVFSNSQADVELGDFGVLFLLFSEGLEVTSSRLSLLTNYLPLSFAQISLTCGVLTAAILSGAPQIIEKFIPLDEGLINVNNPIEAFVLAAACTLSTSAFVFPVLKDREWEDEPVGQAATSVLLLQDLAVAPLLVLLPFIVGQGPTDYSAIGFLTAKATLGFGSVMITGSFLLRRIFALVAETRSTETFVALCLLVSVGMGTIAKSLGLTDTAGAFAAGVLLANTNYRSQIQADILPFKGILLGIFFMGAGSSFDTDLVLAELPTVLFGVFALVFLKAATLFSATKVPEWMEPNRLNPVDAIRLSILLSGGGEFAFVVLSEAEKLGVLPKELGGILTAVVLITMALTPSKGDLAEKASVSLLPLEGGIEEEDIDISASHTMTKISDDAAIICGYNEVGVKVLRSLGNEFRTPALDRDVGLPRLAAIDLLPSLENSSKLPSDGTVVLYGDPTDPGVIQSYGVSKPPAIFVALLDHDKAMLAVTQINEEFNETKIYARAQTRREASELKRAGAAEVVIESDELPRSAPALLRNTEDCWAAAVEEDVRLMAATSAGIGLEEAEELLELYGCMDADLSGRVEAVEVKQMLRKSNTGISSDQEIEKLEAWVDGAVPAPLDPVQFCIMYARAPAYIKDALGDACII